MARRNVALVSGAVTVIALVASIRGTGSQPATPAGPQPESWRIRYEVTEPATGVTSIQVVEVDRPYRARTRNFDPTDGLLGGSIWTEFKVVQISADGVTSTVQDVAPNRPGPDVHLEVALPEAERAGLVERRGTDTVAGVVCTLWTSASPLDTSLPTPARPDESTESCVDEHGRVLRDEWSLDGSVIRTRLATMVDTGPELTDLELFGAGGPEPVPPKFVLTVLRDLQGGDEPGLAFDSPETLLGLPLDLHVSAEDLDLPDVPQLDRRLEQRATYTDGTRLLVLSQSRSLMGVPASLPDGAAVTIAGLDEAVIEISFDGLTVTGLVGDVTVVIRGALSRQELAQLAF